MKNGIINSHARDARLLIANGHIVLMRETNFADNIAHVTSEVVTRLTTAANGTTSSISMGPVDNPHSCCKSSSVRTSRLTDSSKRVNTYTVVIPSWDKYDQSGF